MKYKRLISVLLAVLALIPAMMTAGCSEESHIITQHTSRPDGTASSKPYATNNSLTKDDITLTVWESKDGPDEFIRKAGDSFHKLYPNITIEYVNVEIPDAIINLKDKNSTVKRPDLFASPCDMAGALIANDLILPTIDTSFVNTVAMTSARDSVMYGDTMYGYPVSCRWSPKKNGILPALRYTKHGADILPSQPNHKHPLLFYNVQTVRTIYNSQDIYRI